MSHETEIQAVVTRALNGQPVHLRDGLHGNPTRISSKSAASLGAKVAAALGERAGDTDLTMFIAREALYQARDALYRGEGPDLEADADLIYGEWLGNRADALADPSTPPGVSP